MCKIAIEGHKVKHIRRNAAFVRSRQGRDSCHSRTPAWAYLGFAKNLLRVQSARTAPMPRSARDMVCEIENGPTAARGSPLKYSIENRITA